MKDNASKIRIVFRITAIVVVLIIGAVCVYFGVSGNAFRTAMIAYVAAMFVLWFAINMIYTLKLAKKVNSLLPILYDEANPDRYLAELESLIGSAKSSVFKSVYCINKSAAYCDKEEYEQAKAVLAEMAPQKIPGINRLVYHLNMAFICMHLGEDEEALNIWRANETEFMNLKNSDNAGAVVSALGIYALIKGRRFDDAKMELDVSREKWKRTREQKEFDFLEKLMNET